MLNQPAEGIYFFKPTYICIRTFLERVKKEIINNDINNIFILKHLLFFKLTYLKKINAEQTARLLFFWGWWYSDFWNDHKDKKFLLVALFFYYQRTDENTFCDTSSLKHWDHPDTSTNIILLTFCRERESALKQKKMISVSPSIFAQCLVIWLP